MASSELTARRRLLQSGSAAAIMALLRGETSHARTQIGRAGRRAFAANQTVTALVPDRLYRIGCTVPAKRLSWLPDDLDAWEPLNSYVLVNDGHCIFVDLGISIARPAMEAALATLVGERKVWLQYTRNEADCIGNMGLVLGTCPDTTLLFGGAGGILEWINDPAVSILEVRDFLGRIPIELTPNGTTREFGVLRLQWHDAVVKQMLLTQWVFEESTGSLFTSDFFGFRHLADADDPIQLNSSRRLPAAEIVAPELVARMNWLREANIEDLLRRFETFFRAHDVRLIAPVHGCIITGRDAVAAHVKLATQALRLAARLPDRERLRYG